MNCLYCIKIDGGEIAKVGVSRSPRERRNQLAANSPFKMQIVRSIDFNVARLAYAWEAHILRNADRYRDTGEWVVFNDALEALLDEAAADGTISPLDDDASVYAGRILPAQPENCKRGIHQARLAGIVGIPLASGYDGDPDGYDLALVGAMLRSGYGVDDMQAIAGVPAENARAYVQSMRETGELAEIYSPILEAAQ